MPFVLVTILLDVLTFGLAIPVLPELVKQFSGGDAAQASRQIGWLIASFALMQFVFAPVLGSLSDRFGRRPVILLSVLGAGLDHVLLALAPSIGWLFVGRVLAGLTAANVSAANAYIADVSAPEERAKNFGLIGAAFGVGFIAGPALGGFLGEIDLRLPFWAAAGMAGLNFAYGLFVLPESLRPENRRRFDWRRANPLGSIGALAKHPLVLRLAGVAACNMVAFGLMQTVWVLSTSERFGWTPFHNGLSLTLMGLAAVLVQGGLVAVVVRRAGEKGAMLGGLAMATVAFVIYGAATSSAVFAVAIVLHALGGMVGPAAQGMVSRTVGADEQGQVQGALASLQSLTAIVSPVLGGWLFARFNGPDALAPVPGMPFFVGAGLLVFGFVLARRVLRSVGAPAPAAVGPDPGAV